MSIYHRAASPPAGGSIRHLLKTRHGLEKHHEIVEIPFPVVDEFPIDHRPLEPHSLQRTHGSLLLLDHFRQEVIQRQLLSQVPDLPDQRGPEALVPEFGVDQDPDDTDPLFPARPVPVERGAPHHAVPLQRENRKGRVIVERLRPSLHHLPPVHILVEMGFVDLRQLPEEIPDAVAIPGAHRAQDRVRVVPQRDLLRVPVQGNHGTPPSASATFTSPPGTGLPPHRTSRRNPPGNGAAILFRATDRRSPGGHRRARGPGSAARRALPRPTPRREAPRGLFPGLSVPRGCLPSRGPCRSRAAIYPTGGRPSAGRSRSPPSSSTARNRAGRARPAVPRTVPPGRGTPFRRRGPTSP